MIKVILAALLALVISGCGSQKNSSVAFKPYQSVSKESAILVQSGKERQYCYKCGMDLIRFYKTSHASQHQETHYQYCSIHCLEDHLGEGIILKNPRVVDVGSLKLISVAEAHYVVGSKIRGTMTRTSKYAFLNLVDAQEFQAKNGGKIMDFTKAREITQEDFKHYGN